MIQASSPRSIWVNAASQSSGGMSHQILKTPVVGQRLECGAALQIDPVVVQGISESDQYRPDLGQVALRPQAAVVRDGLGRAWRAAALAASPGASTLVGDVLESNLVMRPKHSGSRAARSLSTAGIHGPLHRSNPRRRTSLSDR